MLEWKLVYGLAALGAVGLVQGKPIELDRTQNNKMVELLDDDFSGVGYRTTQATLVMSDAQTGYEPGTLNTPVQAGRRRLEAAKSVDMKKIENFFGIELETDITKLPAKCQAQAIPWPSGYWPMYADSINYRWSKKQPSPAEKYATAFGYDVKAMMNKISLIKGVNSMKHKTNCTTDDVCKEQQDGSVCAKREGKKKGYCIPVWYGICHAWAPASILEPEPICQVERNGTVFEPYDIKALITLAYDGSKIPTIFTGLRANGNDTLLNATDEHGRYSDERRRDVSPGFFHIAITNLLGRFNHSFVIDNTAGAEVWNQPVRGYEILRLAWTTPAAAAKKYFKVDKYPFNNATTRVAVVTTRLSWIVESGRNGPLVSTGLVDKFTTSADYEYVLETDETYQILGGEWLTGSRKTHPDFLWVPGSKPDSSVVTRVGLVYSEVEELLIESAKGNCKPKSNGKKSEVPEVSAGSLRSSSTESSTEDPSAERNADSSSAGSNEPPADTPPTEAPPPESNAASTDSTTAGSNEPPAEAPPADTPPTEAPPADTPPTEAPPADTPPTEAPPADTPPTEAPPADTPPTEAPPADTPPTEAPPADTPPTEAPPADTPPTEAPPADTPPTEAPPAETPPTEAPPANTPPTEAPPADTPPTEAPPAETPPTEAPPAETRLL